MTLIRYLWNLIIKKIVKYNKQRKALKNSIDLILNDNLGKYFSKMYKNYPKVTYFNFNDSNVRFLYQLMVIYTIGDKYLANAANPQVPFMLQLRYKEILDHLLKTKSIKILKNGDIMRTNNKIKYQTKEFFN